MLSPLQFGTAIKILADTRDGAHDLGATMRDMEIKRGKPASLMEFTFDPDTFYMFSGPELLEATEPPEDLVDELAECPDTERDSRLMNYMSMVHHRLTAAAEVYDFRLLPLLQKDEHHD